MKKILAILLVVLTICAFFAGCKEEKKDPPETTLAATPSTPATTEAPTVESTEPVQSETEPVVTTEDQTTPPETESVQSETEPATAEPTDPTEPVAENSELLKDYKWGDGVIVIDGVLYHTYTDPYMKFEENGWSFNLADYGKDDNYSLNSMEYVFSTIHLHNAEKYGDGYSDPDITIGIINTDSTLKPIKQCMIHVIEVSGVNTFDTFEADEYNPKPCYDFELPQGIRRGSSLEDVKAVFGEAEPEYVGDGDGYHYEKYEYKDEETRVTIELTVYDGYGLQAVRISNSGPRN